MVKSRSDATSSPDPRVSTSTSNASSRPPDLQDAVLRFDGPARPADPTRTAEGRRRHGSSSISKGRPSYTVFALYNPYRLAIDSARTAPPRRRCSSHARRPPIAPAAGRARRPRDRCGHGAARAARAAAAAASARRPAGRRRRHQWPRRAVAAALAPPPLLAAHALERCPRAYASCAHPRRAIRRRDRAPPRAGARDAASGRRDRPRWPPSRPPSLPVPSAPAQNGRGGYLARSSARPRRLTHRHRPGPRRPRPRRRRRAPHDGGRGRARHRAAAREAAEARAGCRGGHDAPHRRLHSARGAHGDGQPCRRRSVSVDSRQLEPQHQASGVETYFLELRQQPGGRSGGRARERDRGAVDAPAAGHDQGDRPQQQAGRVARLRAPRPGDDRVAGSARTTSSCATAASSRRRSSS